MPKARRTQPKSSGQTPEQLDLLGRDSRPVARRARRQREDDGAPPRKKLRHRIWNALAGAGLLPFVWILTDALFDTFANAASRRVPVHFWLSHEFLMLAAGAGAWLVWLGISLLVWKRPTPVRAYVLGHELMHVLMARLSRGQIKDYFFSSEGGYIVTNKYNFLIALAPYLWPFYSVPVLAAWSISLYWEQAWQYREWFLGALGFTWMFHLTFTLWVLPRGQSDLQGPGRIFSIALIYLANAALLSGALIVLAPEVTWRGFGAEIARSTLEFYDGAGRCAAWLVGLPQR